MKNKKIFYVILCTVMALCLTACGTKTADTAAAEPTAAPADEGVSAAEQLAALMDQGFTIGAIDCSDNKVTVNLANGDHTEFRQAVCTMTDEQRDAFLAIDYMAEDCDAQYVDALSACADLQVITPAQPDASLYEGFAGKTIGEMEEAGFEVAACDKDENGSMVVDLYGYTEDDTAYTVRVYPVVDGDTDAFDDDAVRTLVVEKIIFWNFE